MLEVLKIFFASGPFIPHGHCYLWKPHLVWLHILSDSLIALAYYSIPVTLVYFVRKRQDLPFNWIFLLFGSFIVACGTTHVIEIWTLWHPTYWLSGSIKAATAMVSVYTALELVPLVPKALALPSPAQLETANRALLHQINERQRAEEALQKAYDQLEIRVAERTAELRAANQRLQTEIVERQRAEEEVRLLQSMTQAISEAQDFHSALAVVVHKVCEATDWDFGEAWIPQPDKTALVYSAACYSSNNRLEKYRKLSEGLAFPPGIGLPGRVWLSQQPEWLQEVSLQSDKISFRGEIARECGLRCGLGIPIIANEQVLAVLVFFMFDACVEEQRLVETVSAVATQLGGVIQRKQAEEAIKQLNQDLQRQTVELEAANKELEAFSYSVSHDLRAPLRAMNGFSRILLKEYAPQLAPEAKRYLQMVRDNAQQMGQLIDDLLTFSRLSRSPLKKQPVAPTAIACLALTELRHEQENRQVEMSISDLPVCQADPALLKQVWVNLLANALKFTRQRQIARIEVGYQQADGELVYFVKDNGVGFDMQYAHKLFGVFQRLHRAEEYDGTGVGLAIVRRIIDRHGGRVWAEAKVNEGATFYFTLGGKIPHDRDGGRNSVSRRQPQRRGIDTPLLENQ